MGIPSSKLSVELDRDPAIYYGSELVTGIVRLMTNDIHFSQKQLSVNLLGRAMHEITYYRDSEKHHKVVTFTFLSKTVILTQSCSDEQKYFSSHGQHSWLFEIELPTHIPPTFSIPHIFHTYHPAVEYPIIASLQQSVLAITDTKVIFFRPPILLTPQTSVVLSSVNRKDVFMNVNLFEGLFCVAGSVIQGTIQIENPQHKHIKRVECSIIQTLQVKDDSVVNKIIDVILPIMTDGIDNHYEGTFEIPISEYIPPTFQRLSASGESGPPVNVSYTIKFEVCMSGFFIDFSITKPLTVTIDPWIHENDGTIKLIDRTQLV
ncbi:unnamed protein product [Adineta steineri]|uniref:Uncharacterized protein n=1 Tax=Adineta steineri TaxID=433720 RepID=A0A815ADL9_9BILA|nr:unnamed protein product [Adineta steineri]